MASGTDSQKQVDDGCPSDVGVGAAATSPPSSSSSRQALVETAVKFLLNPKVRDSPLSRKRTFLESKGLTAAEIDVAIERAGGAVVPYVPGMHPDPRSFYPPHPMIVPSSRWSRTRDVAALIVLLGGAAYALYRFSRKHLLPYLFGMPSEEERLARLEKQMVQFQESVSTTMTQLTATLRDIQESLQQMSKRQDGGGMVSTHAVPKALVENQFSDLHSEITSLKGLLLNRHQFPSAPVLSPVIPSWQLSDGGKEEVEAVAANNEAVACSTDSADKHDTVL